MRKIYASLLCVLSAVCFAGCSQPKKTPTEFTGDAAAVISLYAYDSESEPTYGLMYLGHSFLSFENVSDEPVTVGALELQPGETCSLGSWSMNMHFGIWYNIESNYIHNAEMYDGRVSLSKSITAEGLAAANEIIADNDDWSLWRNCAYLAVDIFNVTGGDQLDIGGLITPTRVKNEIRRWTNAQVNRPINAFGKAGFSTDKGFEEYDYRERN